MAKFKLKSHYRPAGDQPAAIEALVKGLQKGEQVVVKGQLRLAPGTKVIIAKPAAAKS